MEYNPKARLEKMKKAIKLHMENKINSILDSNKQIAASEQAKIISQQENKIRQDFKNQLEKLIMQRKIEASAKINGARLKKMEVRYELVQKLQKEAKDKVSIIVENKEEYKKILKQLIIECLIKLMEKEVQLNCLRKDLDVVKEVVGESENQFDDLIRETCKNPFTTKILINENSFLDETHKNRYLFYFIFSIGGVILTCNHGKIVCANTLENRINLAFQESLPDIRTRLFPNLK